MAHPVPWEFGLAEKNLTALWANYSPLGYRRLIYTNTVSILMTHEIAAAMGDTPRVVAVLLTSADQTAHERLRSRPGTNRLHPR